MLFSFDPHFAWKEVLNLACLSTVTGSLHSRACLVWALWASFPCAWSSLGTFSDCGLSASATILLGTELQETLKKRSLLGSAAIYSFTGYYSWRCKHTVGCTTWHTTFQLMQHMRLISQAKAKLLLLIISVTVPAWALLATFYLYWLHHFWVACCIFTHFLLSLLSSATLL